MFSSSSDVSSWPLPPPPPPGYQHIDVELKTPPGLQQQPPATSPPLHPDHFFGDASHSSPTDPTGEATPTRPSELSLAQTTGVAVPPLVLAEETTPLANGLAANGLAARETADNDRRSVEKLTKEGEVKERSAAEQKQEVEEEEEEEMTEERLQSLLQDLQQEGGLEEEEEEMTEEAVKAVLERVRRAEKDVCSLAGRTSGGGAESSGGGAPSQEGRWERFPFVQVDFVLFCF